jgi:hypothetical protein
LYLDASRYAISGLANDTTFIIIFLRKTITATIFSVLLEILFELLNLSSFDGIPENLLWNSVLY